MSAQAVRQGLFSTQVFNLDLLLLLLTYLGGLGRDCSEREGAGTSKHTVFIHAFRIDCTTTMHGTDYETSNLERLHAFALQCGVDSIISSKLEKCSVLFA